MRLPARRRQRPALPASAPADSPKGLLAIAVSVVVERYGGGFEAVARGAREALTREYPDRPEPSPARAADLVRRATLGDRAAFELRALATAHRSAFAPHFGYRLSRV